MAQTAEGVARWFAEVVARGDAAPGSAVPSVRELAHRHGCSPGTAQRALTALRQAGVVAGVPRARGRVTHDGAARAGVLLAGQPGLRLAGSDDPLLDALLRASGPAVSVTGRRGSVHGLGALASGAADAAVVHLRHVHNARETDDFAAGALGGDPVRVVHLWRRTQGLAVPRGNPRSLRNVADVVGHRLAWRNPGSGTRLLLMRLLADAGADGHPQGPGEESHLGVAVAVAAGAADAGLCVGSAALAAGTDWVPLVDESFEVVVGAEHVGRVDVLLSALGAPAVRRVHRRSPGYDLSRSGEVRAAA